LLRIDREHPKGKMKMKKIIWKMFGGLAVVLSMNAVQAAGSNFPLDKAPSRVNNEAALQNGAKLFVNYCLNCHGAVSMRYNRLRDIGLTDEQIKQNLLFSGEKVGDMMNVAISPKDAKAWFGAMPPDLSVIARAKGVDYLYTYLRTYYQDDTKMTGWNNMAYPAVAMPNVFWELQGIRKAKYVDEKDPHDATKTIHVFKGFEQVTPGKLKLNARKELAGELGVNAGAHGSAEQNMALIKAVWVALEQNGGIVPASLRD
jgi:ubiquinol-cytochrome c reductase cytochrome c1 subunit